jgi:CRISPR-associated endonuclease/helicase Cas3
MSTFDVPSYSQRFQEITGHEPFAYQAAVARALCGGRNVILQAPTGAGKTWSVIVPFLHSGWERRPSRLIYALPLRTLAQGIFHEAQEAAIRLGHPVHGESDEHGRVVVSPYVTLQTGEQPDDPFFDRGKVIITTYDQVLSGVLDGPYGLSDRLHNINAAAIAGALVVFDEFHLMEPSKAFLTGIAGLYLFRDLCQSVWMTATATRPLIEMVREALGAELIPADEMEAKGLENSLPSVTQVRREIRMESSPLTPEVVLEAHHRKSIVLLNTVGRAQAMYMGLKRILGANDRSTTLILLHSRFFRQDRAAKEQALRDFLAKSSSSDVILVATQVVEAGLDISCEHLHTELCPMNSLVQRAGRCARFPGQAGVVHVYLLPDQPRAWLPYGDIGREDGTLTKTREILAREPSAILKPSKAAQWVEEAHAQEDSNSLRIGWQSRVAECLRRIDQNAIHRNHVRVADLIREGSDQIRVILREHVSALDRPGQWDGINLSRWSLTRFFRNATQDIGWSWDPGDVDPWKKIESEEQLRNAYIICLRPGVAAYDSEVGIQLAATGSVESPPREEPKRPGYSPLHSEKWADHALRVADEARKRLHKEGWPGGLLSSGLARRYGFSADDLREVVRACALLHDFGKLQETWQRWAEAAQQARDGSYRHSSPLAHTDFNPEDARDRARERSLGIRRPPHAAAGAYFAVGFLPRMLASISPAQLEHGASACSAAILSHHGAWLSGSMDLGVSELWPGWEESVAGCIGWTPDAVSLEQLAARRDKRGPLQQLLNLTVGSDSLREWWPFVAYFTRTLRLSDQRATAQGGANE